MPKYDSLELGADSQLKYFAGYPVQGGTALTLPELNGSSVAVPITSTPLAASANFTGATQDRLNVTAGATAVSGGIPLSQQGGVLVSKVKGSVYSDQAGTLYVEESNDNSTWTQTTTLAVSAGIFTDTGWVYLSKRYYRLRYANGTTAQNTFALFQSVGAGQSDVQLMGSNNAVNATLTGSKELYVGTNISVPAGSLAYVGGTIDISPYNSISGGMNLSAAATAEIDLNYFIQDSQGNGYSTGQILKIVSGAQVINSANRIQNPSIKIVPYIYNAETSAITVANVQITGWIN